MILVGTHYGKAAWKIYAQMGG